MLDGMRRLLILLAVLSFLSPLSALASGRVPTAAERQQLLTAAYRALGHRPPVGCARYQITVSLNGSFGRVDPLFRANAWQRCQPGNGFFVFRRAASRWKLVFVGSEVPSCYDARYSAAFKRFVGCIDLPDGQP